MSHILVNFDRTGFKPDLDIIVPTERLAKLEAEGARLVDGRADYNDLLMGATAPERALVRQIAAFLKGRRG